MARHTRIRKRSKCVSGVLVDDGFSGFRQEACTVRSSAALGKAFFSLLCFGMSRPGTKSARLRLDQQQVRPLALAAHELKTCPAVLMLMLSGIHAYVIDNVGLGEAPTRLRDCWRRKMSCKTTQTYNPGILSVQDRSCHCCNMPHARLGRVEMA